MKTVHPTRNDNASHHCQSQKCAQHHYSAPQDKNRRKQRALILRARYKMNQHLYTTFKSRHKCMCTEKHVFLFSLCPRYLNVLLTRAGSSTCIKKYRTAFLHFSKIGILSQSHSEKLVDAFIASRLENCHLLLSGCSKSSLKTLRLIQNAAVRGLMRTRKERIFFSY